ncbi:hypothetical protein [Streptomyces sp. WMMB303]|uniref:hypothetical protein n=1 Tax=Streptomyces sp. WMMB303 TaxID=3034154 RepID=UPI0023EB50FB|nr:hypothetical protein [Streptomyces sp. WMMB303]MDF4253899.1 hypothetical protein [Streptomyces sp. WMMB303]
MSSSGRTQLLFVHGIGGLRDAEQERRTWLEALADGARKAGHADAVSGLTQGWLSEARFVDYSDLFSDPEVQGGGENDIPGEQVEFLEALVRDMVDELAREAEREGDRQTLRVVDDARDQLQWAGDQSQGLLGPVRVLMNVMTTFLQVPGVRRAAQWVNGRSLLGHLAQVSRYLDRAERDSRGRALDVRIRERLLRQTDPGRPLVVVAHSLGTVVSFEALHEYTGSVELLVTLGSPLATGAAVRQRIRPVPARTPEVVARWLNFWDRDDIFVSRPRLRWMLPNTSGIVPTTNRVDSDGIWVHTATKYLRQPAVAGPIAEVLKR